ncbi:polyprenyl synthetase family protein [Paeniglutamicibacter antarcticus]|uniref:Polyprenyl synthetase family protein n=1 Tax=Arthrobacter terrae TaxID=2935737 RepID=A0A931CPK2_9MICC|nr:polyprenyl synthetase family protein [Arthrobacter terrae]MBG0740190.1 polyprenyl synthetase family protein [Arthrobacter terrae]
MLIPDVKLHDPGVVTPRTSEHPNAAAAQSTRQLENYLQHVEVALRDFFASSKLRGQALTPRFARLWESLEATTDGGKRFRPRLVFTAGQGLGGVDLPTAAAVGAAFELLHTALIVHDDVIDRDFVRRGRPNLAGQYLAQALDAGLPVTEAEHRAMSIGIVAGDVALVNAYRLIDHAVSGPVRDRLLEIMDEAVLASAAGELLDIEFSVCSAALMVEDIVEMDRLKTAVYSFEAPLKAGAVLAGASEQTIAAIGQAGRSMGIAYQIIDDLLGVFGDEAGTGKSTLGDVREGKRTVLTNHASRAPQWSAIAAHLGNPDLTREDAQEVRSLLILSGSRDYAQRLAGSFGDQALSRLARADIPEPLRRELEQIVSSVLTRSR